MADPGRPTTLKDLFWDSVAKNAPRDAQGWNEDGTWRHRTYQEFGEAVRAAAKGLKGLKLRKGDRVALWSPNAPRWGEVDFAALSTGLATVPIYDTLTAQKAAYILKDSGAKVLFVQGGAMLEEALRACKEAKGVKHVVALSGAAGHKGAMDYETFLAGGAGQDDKALDRAMAGVQPDDLASLVYTSGTTGEPKGVMLTHWNFASNVQAIRQLVEFGAGDVLLSFLPLSHVFERSAGHFAAYSSGAHVVFARSIDTLVEDLGQVRPTVMLSVPRLYEKVHARIQANVQASGFVKRFIFAWALDQGRAANVYRQRNEALPRALERKVQRADRLVFGKIKERVGGRLRFFVSGGAALSPRIEEFFWAAGIPILQGYGLTETSPVTNVNTFEHLRFGSVGRPVPGVEVRIDASRWQSTREGVVEGEICIRGPNVMQGYWKLKKETKAVFDKDGWFRTGDVGYVDEDGFLSITDRLKEVIVMSNGKNVAPQPIEGMLKLQGHIGNACVVGDDRKYIAALVVPDFEALEQFALENGLAADDPELLVADQRVVSLIEKEVEDVNRQLPRYEQIKKFWIVAHDWTTEGGELTPTLKLKRRVLLERYKKVIAERLYPED